MQAVNIVLKSPITNPFENWDRYNEQSEQYKDQLTQLVTSYSSILFKGNNMLLAVTPATKPNALYQITTFDGNMIPLADHQSTTIADVIEYLQQYELQVLEVA